MSNCSCVYAGDTCEGEFYSDRIVKAKKKHKCCECRHEIKSGEKYEYTFGVWEGDPAIHKTCLDCVAVRNEFFCHGWAYGLVWEQLEEHICGNNGEISSECILRLPEKAKEKVLDIIQKFFDSIK